MPTSDLATAGDSPSVSLGSGTPPAPDRLRDADERVERRGVPGRGADRWGLAIR
jgi:hypothetical protein